MVSLLLAGAKPKATEPNWLADPMILGFLAILVAPFAIAIAISVWLQGRKDRKAAAARAIQNKEEAAAFFAQPVRSVGTNLILQDGEEALRTEPTALYETRATRVYGGGGTRIGGIAVGGGASQSHDRMRKIDTGTLVLTTKRLIFDGDHENRNFKLKDLLSVQAFADGIEVSTQRRAKSLVFSVSNPLIWQGLIQAVATGKFTVRE